MLQLYNQTAQEQHSVHITFVQEIQTKKQCLHQVSSACAKPTPTISLTRVLSGSSSTRGLVREEGRKSLLAEEVEEVSVCFLAPPFFIVFLFVLHLCFCSFEDLSVFSLVHERVSRDCFELLWLCACSASLFVQIGFWCEFTLLEDGSGGARRAVSEVSPQIYDF